MEILTLQRRLVEVGRIRLGEKRTTANGKTFPARLTKFRLTSRDRARLDAAAALYGGIVTEWDGQWQLYTETDVLPVAVVPGQAISQAFELWGQVEKNGRKSGVICLRRCDGEQDYISGQPCLCQANDEQVCKPTTRLSVVLTDVPGIGVWRVEAHGWNAASELVGGVRLLESLVATGRPVSARLRLDFRTQTTENETRQFVVPVIDIDHTLGQVLEAVGHEARLDAAELAEHAEWQADKTSRPALTPVPATVESAPVGTIAEQVATPPPPIGRRTPAQPPTGITAGPVCVRCGGSLLGQQVEIVQGVGRAHKGGCPSGGSAGEHEAPADTDGNGAEVPVGPEPAATLDDAKRFAIDCRKAFAAAYNAAPKGDKTKRLDRLRHALVWAVSGKSPRQVRTVHYAELSHGGQLAASGAVGDIIRGDVTYEYTDTAAVFTFNGVEVVVPWTELPE